MTDESAETRRQLDALAAAFFGAFSNRDGRLPRLDDLAALFIPNGTISQRSGATAELLSVADFVAPRRALFASGTLVDFAEEELSSTTTIAGSVAQRHSRYGKSGTRDGVPFTALGQKFFQFVRTPDGWRIASVVWDDERDA